METWKPIVGFEGLYDVSDLGHVRTVKSRKIKTLRYSKGYLFVSLFDRGRVRYAPVNRLVLEAFVGPAPRNHDGAHLDGTRDNNVLANLAWVSRADNQLHRVAHGTALWGETNPNAKLTKRQVAEIRALAGIVGPKELAARYGVGRSMIQKINRGEMWREDRSEKLAASRASLQSASNGRA